MIEQYVAPKFTLISKRIAELPFVGTIGAATWLTILTSPISYPFRIVQAKMTFTHEARNLVQYSWLISKNAGTSVTGYPSGDNIFAKETPTAYFIGNAIEKVINCNAEVPDKSTIIKLCTHNLNPYAYYINCTLMVQEM